MKKRILNCFCFLICSYLMYGQNNRIDIYVSPSFHESILLKVDFEKELLIMEWENKERELNQTISLKLNQQELQQLNSYIEELYKQERKNQVILDSILNNNGIPYPPQLDGICFYISPSHDASEWSSCIENHLFLNQVFDLLSKKEKDETLEFHPHILLIQEEYLGYR